ncbi:MAG: hypothetical protein D6726_02870 [Nitrospirae bacterium]|nr:MAG: hypothetical protein D6726_02870 [Nitrospirota bacterium]
MIQRIHTFEDSKLNEQFDHIVSNQFKNNRTLSVTFAGAETQQVDIGEDYKDLDNIRFLVVGKNANIDVWLTAINNTKLSFTSSGAGTVKIMVWKED